MTAEIHRAAERRFAPWKNGGGETAEILCHPEGAGFDSFDWRISTARVDRSGPFSAFAGVDRVLTVLEGGAMDLRFEDGGHILAGPGTGPHPFPGDSACTATLRSGPLLDLNLMVRRPLRGSVHLPGQEVAAEGLRACYLFAVTDLPGMGLARHDLLVLPEGAQVAPEGALLIAIHDA
ncbi:HutD/Ves family protein [Oceanicola sp. S124]|uniref:HutD/Ves family protein n=1 Tax=Oceanicola sp. S124 TaxID=1042378 RepID=UPI00025581CD|nr:HutD family protein [Oceanicola sp. S124]